MRLSKADRETVKQKFEGRCAYCGALLGERWHADHFEAVVRDMRWESGKGFVATGTMLKPHCDTIDNMMPACAPCNIDKSSNSLEWWRGKLARSAEVLARNNPTYRHALRFGLVEETGAPITFYFERVSAVGQHVETK